jgi:hypothetical protein
VSKLVFTILSAVAEAERDRTRERIQEVKRDQRDRGRYLGGTTPFGYRLGEGGELVEDPDQQAAIKRMRKLRRSGKSLRAIAELMGKQGVKISHVGVKKLAETTLRRGPGRPKTVGLIAFEIRQAARAHCPEAVERLAALMRSKDERVLFGCLRRHH